MAAVDARTLGTRIREARKRAGMNQDELGRAMGIERTAVNKIENGVRRVSALELSDAAAAIGVRMSVFFDEPVPALVSHRSSQGLDTADSQIDALLATLVGEVELVASLDGDDILSGADAVTKAGIEPPTGNQEADALAATARELMGLSKDEPIRMISDYVAKIGLLAFSRDIGKDTADAGTVLLRRGGVSLINSHMRVGRRRLALAHELGHYLIADDYTVDWRVTGHQDQLVPLESRLDRFARALLLPQAAIKRNWRQLTDESDDRTAAIRLASEFRIDMATLAIRLKELGLAEPDTVEAVRKYRTTRSDIVELNLHNPPEELEGVTVPNLFARSVVRLVRDEQISRERALDLLQGTFNDADLPSPRQRRPDEIWHFVS